jgi:hypothetical protein
MVQRVEEKRGKVRKQADVPYNPHPLQIFGGQ